MQTHISPIDVNFNPLFSYTKTDNRKIPTPKEDSYILEAAITLGAVGGSLLFTSLLPGLAVGGLGALALQTLLGSAGGIVGSEASKAILKLGSANTQTLYEQISSAGNGSLGQVALNYGSVLMTSASQSFFIGRASKVLTLCGGSLPIVSLFIPIFGKLNHVLNKTPRLTNEFFQEEMENIGSHIGVAVGGEKMGWWAENILAVLNGSHSNSFSASNFKNFLATHPQTAAYSSALISVASLHALGCDEVASMVGAGLLMATQLADPTIPKTRPHTQEEIEAKLDAYLQTNWYKTTDDQKTELTTFLNQYMPERLSEIWAHIIQKNGVGNYKPEYVELYRKILRPNLSATAKIPPPFDETKLISPTWAIFNLTQDGDSTELPSSHQPREYYSEGTTPHGQFAFYTLVGTKGTAPLHNDDHVQVLTVQGKTILVCADGLGQDGQGDIATHVAMTLLKNSFKDTPDKPLKLVFQDLQEIYSDVMPQRDNHGTMATTLTIAVISEENGHLTLQAGAIGDSPMSFQKPNENDTNIFSKKQGPATTCIINNPNKSLYVINIDQNQHPSNQHTYANREQYPFYIQEKMVIPKGTIIRMQTDGRSNQPVHRLFSQLSDIKTLEDLKKEAETVTHLSALYRHYRAGEPTNWKKYPHLKENTDDESLLIDMPSSPLHQLYFHVMNGFYTQSDKQGERLPVIRDNISSLLFVVT